MDEEIASSRREGEDPRGRNRLQAEAEQSSPAGDKAPGTDKTPTTTSLPQLEITGTDTSSGGSGSNRRNTSTPASSDRTAGATDSRAETAAPATPADPLDRSIVEMDRALSRIPDADRRRVASEVAEIQTQIEQIGLKAAAKNQRPLIPPELLRRIERLDGEINKMLEPLKAVIAEQAQLQGRGIEAKSITFTCAPVGYNGQYAMGRATLSFRAAPFLPQPDGQPYDVNALGTVNHELTHRGQDGLIIRRFADQLREKGRFSLEALMEMYEKKLGEPLDPRLAFYHSLDERPLPAEEARRADRLLKSFQAMQENKAELTRIELSINRVTSGLKFLKEVGANNFIREAINNNPATLKSYFGEPTPADVERHLKAFKEGGFDPVSAYRDFERAMNEHNARLAQQYDEKYKSQPHEREAYAEGDRTTRRAVELRSSGRPAPAASAEIPDVHRRALEIAKSIKSAQADLKLVDRAQVQQLLNSTLDAIDEGKTPWAEADRRAIVKLIEDYVRGDATATRAVHSFLGIEMPAETASTRAGSAPVDTPQTLKDLERQLEEPARRAELVARMLERGPLRETLTTKGMSDERARQLERDLLSEKREVREKAMEEIGRYYRGKGGARGFASEVKGRLGALVMVAAVLLPFVFAEAAREDNAAPTATWR
jgi:hypothetical protein